MKKKRVERLVSLILIVFAAFSGAALSSVLSDETVKTKKNEEKAETVMSETDLPAAAVKECVLLLIGVDGNTGNVGLLMLTRVDPVRKTISALQIPPNTVASDAGNAKKIVETVSGLTNVGIDAYLSLNTDGFAKAIDQMGGIRPDFPTAFEADGKCYPQGTVSLDGKAAAALMCAEIGSDDGFDTFAVQELLLRETLGRIRTEFSLMRAAALAGAVYPHVGTDLRFSEILSLVRAGMGMDGKDVVVYRFEGK